MTIALPMPTSLDSRTLLIAELSANHNGSIDKAIETIHAAREAGADAIKLQTYTPDTMTLDVDRAEFRIEDGPWAGRHLYELYDEAHTPWDWHARLMEVATEVGLPLFSTPFDATAVDFLEDLGVTAYKVASFEITDLPLIRRIAATQKPVIMSTGMSNLAEIDNAVRTIRAGWAGQDHGLVLLKCVSAYPARPEDMNLRTIPHLAEAFGVVSGLSDHTLGTAVAVAAVALGARAIEKHFTMRRADGGPDSHFSLEPAEFAQMAAAVREAEAALGEVRFGVGAIEASNVKFRRSIFASRDIEPGEAFSADNVRIIRPGYGLEPNAMPLLVTRRAATRIERGTPLSWSLVGGPSGS